MDVKRQALYLCGWIGLAAALAFSTLTLKPLWTDEFATIVFSLGHSFKSVPIDQWLDLPTLLAPLEIQPPTSWAMVLHRLLTEDTHPPVFFWLNYSWMQAGARWLPQWFLTGELTTGDWPSVFAARSLSALCGVLCVPAMFALAWVTTRKVRVAQLAAGLMAVSPFGLFLAQESRHYSLATLWVILSLTGWMGVVRAWQQRVAPSIGQCLGWVLVNALGIATHYFFSLILAAEAMVLLLLAVNDVCSKNRLKHYWEFWSRIGLVAVGTAVNGFIWLATWRSIDRELIQWVYTGAQTGWAAWVNPIVNLLVGGITMLTLWPIQGVARPLAIGGGLLTLVSAIGLTRMAIRGLRQQWQGADRLPLWAAIGALSGAIVGLLYLDYGGGADVTRGFRFNFLYLPTVLLLTAWGLAANRWVSRAAIGLGLIGCLSVGHNFAYQKVHQVPLIVDAIVQWEPPLPTLILAPFRTHAQTTRLMSLAWELQRRGRSAQFYLDRQQCPKDNPAACKQLTPLAQQAIQAQITQPVRLWLINYNPLDDLSAIGCVFDREMGARSTDGFVAQPYRCTPP
jgi:uncharacterized membrane protein